MPGGPLKRTSLAAREHVSLSNFRRSVFVLFPVPLDNRLQRTQFAADLLGLSDV